MKIIEEVIKTARKFLKEGSKTEKSLFVFFSCLVSALFFYSFTQIDLSLTLSRVSIWQGIQKSFQYIGYFNRPLSSFLFLLLIGALFGVFIYTLMQIQKKKVGKTALFCMIGFATLVLAFSYNAFSYDIFNYIFDAKIVTFYNQNPYTQKALDYLGDPMLSFMRWTHRLYPYGPSWLLLTVPVSFIGMGYFVPTFFLFKLLMAFSFIGSVILLYKILQKFSPQSALLGTAFFALNPLVLIESLVSAHNDIVMLFFVLLGIHRLVSKKFISAYIILVFAYGIKFATASLPFAINPILVHAFSIILMGLGIYLFSGAVRKDEVGAMRKVAFVMLALMICASLLATYRTTFQPWYIVSILPFVSIFIGRLSVILMVLVISLFALLNYLPYLYLGNWDQPVPIILLTFNVFGLALAGLLGIIFYKKRIYE